MIGIESDNFFTSYTGHCSDYLEVGECACWLLHYCNNNRYTLIVIIVLMLIVGLSFRFFYFPVRWVFFFSLLECFQRKTFNFFIGQCVIVIINYCFYYCHLSSSIFCRALRWYGASKVFILIPNRYAKMCLLGLMHLSSYLHKVLLSPALIKNWARHLLSFSISNV